MHAHVKASAKVSGASSNCPPLNHSMICRSKPLGPPSITSSREKSPFSSASTAIDQRSLIVLVLRPLKTKIVIIRVAQIELFHAVRSDGRGLTYDSVCLEIFKRGVDIF